MQHAAPMGWTAPGFRMGGRFPLAVQNMCQRLMTHGAFVNYHTTPMKDWHKVRHMLTLKRDKDTRSNYAHDAIQALCQYTEYASNNDREVQQLLLDVATVDYSSWATELDSISAVVNAGLGVVELPVSQVEQLERQSREAEAALMQQIQRADEADARRREKNREKKRARSSNPDSSQPTVSLLEYEPPPEQSSDEADVAKKLDLDAEAQSQQAEVQEPNTPEQLLNQPAPLDEGYDPGPPPRDVDAPERVEEQQSHEDTGQAEDESDKPPPEGDKPEGNEGEGEGQESSGQRPGSLPTLLIHQSLLIQMLLIPILMRKKRRRMRRMKRMRKVRRKEKRVKKESMAGARKKSVSDPSDPSTPVAACNLCS